MSGLPTLAAECHFVSSELWPSVGSTLMKDRWEAEVQQGLSYSACSWSCLFISSATSPT